MTHPEHRPITDPVAQFVVAHYGADLPIVLLSCNRPGTRAPSRTRALPPGSPAAPRRTPPIIDANTFEPAPICGTCYSRRVPPQIAAAASRAPEGSRFLAFVGRIFPGVEIVPLPATRPVIDVDATEVR